MSNSPQNPTAFVFCKWALQFVRIEAHETLKHETPQRAHITKTKVAKSYKHSLTTDYIVTQF